MELLTGSNPTLSFYTIVRKGEELPIERCKGFDYKHLAYLLKDKMIEPFLVTVPYRPEEQDKRALSICQNLFNLSDIAVADNTPWMLFPQSPAAPGSLGIFSPQSRSNNQKHHWVFSSSTLIA